MDLLIRKGMLTDASGEAEADLLIRDGVIAAMGRDLQADAPVLDAEGLRVLPAFVDLHCHLRTPGQTHKETVQSASRAAVRGGYTTLNAMANTTPVCSSAEIARAVAEEARRGGLCDVYQCLSLTKDFDGTTLSHLRALPVDVREVVRCVSEDGRGVADGRVLRDALRLCAEKGLRVLVHAEDPAFTGVDMAFAEDLETLRDLHIAETEGLPVHFCHVSTAVSAAAIAAAKRRGTAVTWEVTPHHLALSDSTDFRVNPPLRPERDRRALISAVLRGEAEAISTDHAPHTREDKENGAPGLVGLETAFPVCYTVLCREEGLPLAALVRLMSENPANLLGISKGALRIGLAGDVTLADLRVETTLDSRRFASMGRNTPFDGRKVWGKIVKTIKAGAIVYEEEAKHDN